MDVNGENPTLPPFLTFQLKFTASCDEVSQAIFNDITKDIQQKGLSKLISTLKDTCEQIIHIKNKNMKKVVAETKSKLQLKNMKRENTVPNSSKILRV